MPARPNGEIDYAALTRALADSKAQGKPAVLSLNVGTTVRGAIDDVDRALEALREAGYQKGEYYIHADAALVSVRWSAAVK